MKLPISIKSMASVSALGAAPETVARNFADGSTYITEKTINNQHYWIAAIPDSCRAEVMRIKKENQHYKSLDDTVVMAIWAARQAVAKARWKDDSFGINLGSSRGATHLFEQYFEEYMRTGKAATLASPSTTLGNIATWVAQDLQNNGPAISHSITCSTGLHAVLNAVAWLQSGMSNKFLVGASEAPLTPFTLAQMQALKIYSKEKGAYPCRSFDLQKKRNTMVLGEAASVACLETGESPNALAYIKSVGYAIDSLEHSISITEDAVCFQKSMQMALQNSGLSTVDAIVMHAPGTIKGDISEYRAIQKIFGTSLPMLTTNKWKLGHTFATSGMMSLEQAVWMLQQQQFIGVPFTEYRSQPATINSVLINAVGFGGNAVSILVTKNA